MPYNHFQLLKRVLAFSISNRVSSFWNLFDIKWPSQNLYWMHFGKHEIWGKYQSFNHFEYHKGHLNVWLPIQWPPPPQSLNDHPFYMYFICPQGITYNPGPEGSGGYHQRHNFRTFQLSWTKWLSQNFVGMCMGKCWAWKGGLLPSNHFRLLKRALVFSFSNWLSSFEVFMTTNGHLKVSMRWISRKYEVWERGGGYPPYDHSES